MYSCVFLGYFSVLGFFVVSVIPFIRLFIRLKGHVPTHPSLPSLSGNMAYEGNNKENKKSSKLRNNPETHKNTQEVSCFLHSIEEMLKFIFI